MTIKVNDIVVRNPMDPSFLFLSATLTIMERRFSMDPSQCLYHFRFQANGSLFTYFNGIKDINSLPVQPLDKEQKQELQSRGRKFINLKGRHHLDYDGLLIQDENTSPPMGPPYLGVEMSSIPVQNLNPQAASWGRNNLHFQVHTSRYVGPNSRRPDGPW